MRKRVRISLVILLVFVAGVIGWQIVAVSEPMYQGQPLSKWLRQYDRLINNPYQPWAQRTIDPGTAIHEIGTNAIPLLLSRLRAHDSPLMHKVKLLARRLPLPMIQQRTALELNGEGISGFRALGRRGNAAIPQLVKWLDEPLFAKNAMCVLTSFDDEAAIPVLINATTNANPQVRRVAVIDLGHRRRNADAIVHSLLHRLADEDANVRSGSAEALGKFPDQPALIIPALIGCLQDTNTSVQEFAAQSLGSFGEKAKGAVPRLVEIVKLRGPVCSAAGTLRLIDPVTADQVGLARLRAMPSFE